MVEPVLVSGVGLLLFRLDVVVPVAVLVFECCTSGKGGGAERGDR